MSRDCDIFATIAATTPPPHPVPILDTAVVMGGSVAGLLAARVLADHAARVLIVERDDPDRRPGPRPGVPQGRQGHVLLAAGARHLERWFPGFTDRAVGGGGGRGPPPGGVGVSPAGGGGAGACLVPAADSVLYDDGIARVNGSPLRRLALTRPFLEDLLREELTAFDPVRTVHGLVRGLEFGPDAVTGIRLRGPDDVDRSLQADLVIDALGRSSRVSEWLDQAGWDRPALTRIPAGVNYATAVFRRPPTDPPVKLLVALVGTGRTDALSGAVCFTVEDDRYVVMQGGYGDFRPGGTAEDMVTRCRQGFPAPFGRVVANEMLGDVVTYRHGDSRRRDFATCRRLPARLIPIGDSVATFNPLYGQGMSSAALQCAALSRYLGDRPDLDRPAREFLDLQRVVVDTAWSVATAADAAVHRRVSGERTGLRDRIAGRAVALVVRGSMTDPVVHRAYVDVTQMLSHPETLARPGVLARSLVASCRRRPAPEPPLDPPTAGAPG